MVDEALVDALKRKVNHQAERIDQLEEQVAELLQVVDTDMAAVDYEKKTRKDKVREIRTALYRNSNANGRATMNYREVVALFNGHPSPGHAYDLMQLVANADGYEYRERTEGENKIAVQTADVNDDAVIHAANNEEVDAAA